ncbi:MAG TPA: TRAP transporter small permease [Burkholderiales bacterium]|jgi:TRAP-type C4-dicarboxylate transport system permease small subunit
MAKLLGRLVALVEWWAVFLLAALAALVCFGVFFRYALNSSLTWYDEFASYMLVWLTFYGTVVADYRRKHIGFELLVDKLAPLQRRVVDFVAEIAVLGFQFVLFYYGWILSERMGDESAASITWVKVSWINSVLPITGGLLLLISVARLIGIVTGKTNKQGGHEAWSGSSSE